MARTAEYSIKGYLYQFLRYMSEILTAGAGTRVTIEGAIEDIDVASPHLTTAVQCKYHEQAEKFTLGKIYKPVLLMLEHFSANPATAPKVEYRLFCHFQDQTGTQKLTLSELRTVLASTAEGLKPIIARLPAKPDLAGFSRLLTIEFGPSAEDLQKTVIGQLCAKGFSPDDVEALVFPNAIQRIVDLATRGEISDRTVDAAAFVSSLREVRKVTFTRWTRELATREKIYKRLKDDLKPSLAHNSRGRVFVIDPANIAKFDDEIVRFISKFTERYSSKYLHDNPPLFMISGGYDIGALVTRLHDARIRCADGLVGASFRPNELFRSPMVKRKPFNIEFSARVADRAAVSTAAPSAMDELFLVNTPQDPWLQRDVNVYKFEIERLSEIEYVFQLRNDYA